MNRDLIIEEKWKSVFGWELYEVSNFGNVRNSVTGKIKKQQKNNRGYFICQFEIKDRKSTKLVHRLVAFAFCLKHQDDKVVNHIDGNKRNNMSSNLEWCSQKHNINEAIRMGTFDPRKNGMKGLKKRWNL